MTIPTPATDIELLRQMRSGSADTAADIVQEVFMGLLTDSLRFDALRGELRPFLFGVARNLLLKHEAPRLRHPSLPEPDEEGEREFDAASDAAEPLARMLDNELAEEVRRALALLPPPLTPCAARWRTATRPAAWNTH
ncbi:RNA polymerase sigma factor [Duganella radicis]|uniref:RNA polymerase sigma-70 region 2 domain-containing protein n=1 Tax=Duganella radicis TaxID=551988 RepID=A0A6L6PG32_9BURK|nr:sigma factor [Duganella radicis]MTV37974.1 hypothetical protein [Duganella radicis]